MNAPDQVPANQTVLSELAQFIYREARLQDEHRYEEWEALWTDDGVYWIPANGEDIDPEVKMSIVYDNRSRIRLRVQQLLTGKRLSQSPPSRLRRVVSNIELLQQQGDDIVVASNALIFESNTRGEQLWAARNEYTLRRDDASFRMARKKVVLVNNDKPLYTLSFLI
jgi:3-phenylpropionate/cinnamic acid dioxygenase small subunit